MTSVSTATERSRGSVDIRAILGRFFRTLENQSARYAVLRATEEVLREDAEIDLIVPPSSLHAIREQVLSLAEAHGGIRVAYWREFPMHAATVILAWPRTGGGWNHLFFDIRTAVHKKGFLLLEGRELSDRNTVWDDQLRLRRLRNELECAHLLVRNTLDGRAASEKHEQILRERWTDSVPEVVRSLGFELRGPMISPVNGASRGTAFIRRFRYRLQALFGRIRCTGGGMNIVIYGPDGVGKSTLAGAVAGFFRGVGVRGGKVRVFHAFRETLPGRPTRPAARSSVRLRAYKSARRRLARVLVLSAGYVKRLAIFHGAFRRRVRRGAIFVHDRYFFDVFLKYLKSHGGRERKLERLLAFLAPSTDLVFVLRADPRVVSARTGELTPDEVEEAYELLDDCVRSSRISRVSIIDANQSPQKVCDAVVERLLEAQTARALSEVESSAGPTQEPLEWTVM